MNNLNTYFKYEKENLSVQEKDFSRILNCIETKGISYNSSNTIKSRSLSEYLGWTFGAVGMSMAAFFFFLTPNTNTAEVATISQNDVETLRQKSQKALDTVNSINSFDNN